MARKPVKMIIVGDVLILSRCSAPVTVTEVFEKTPDDLVIVEIDNTLQIRLWDVGSFDIFPPALRDDDRWTMNT